MLTSAERGSFAEDLGNFIRGNQMFLASCATGHLSQGSPQTMHPHFLLIDIIINIRFHFCLRADI